MNHNYQSVKETLAEKVVGIDESYIGKALREYGLEEFPEAGLSDIGLSRLVKTATDIYHSEIDLTPRKPVKGNLPVPKIKKEKERSLEAQILKKETPKVARGILKTITYPTIGVTFLLPTMYKKVWSTGGDTEFFENLTTFGAVVETIGMYFILANTNPKLVPYAIATQLVTNIVSGGYEIVKSISGYLKKK